MIDSLEGKSASDITQEDFERTHYERSIRKSGDLIESGKPVYKLITSENWSVVFPLSDEDKEAYAERKSLQIKPSNSDLTLSGNYSQITGGDGGFYGKLDFNKFMIQFVSDRFMDFEIVSDEAAGLKIPVSSVTTKEFFTIPVGYLTRGGDATMSESGFYKEVYSESGEPSVVFTPAAIYNSTDEYYYVDKSESGPFKSGDYIVKPDSSERYQLGPVAMLEGAYNINKGYAVFKLVKELTNNGEYYIIEKGTSYGLSVYDHIVLDASTVTEGQIIYQ